MPRLFPVFRLLPLPALLLSGCAGTGSTGRPGIQPEEEVTLTKGYYWKKGQNPEQFTDAEIKALFDRAPAMLYLNGERTELYTAELCQALAAAGDRRYAALLAREPVRVQSKVLHFVRSFMSGEDYLRMRRLPGNQYLPDEEKAQQRETDERENPAVPAEQPEAGSSGPSGGADSARPSPAAAAASAS